MRERLWDLIVVGAGPAGLECALAARARDWDVLVLEAAQVGANLRRIGFVELFTPWALNVSSRGREYCEGPLDGAKTSSADEFVSHYLEPIAACELLRDRVREGVRVRWIGRSHSSKSEGIGDPHRARLPLLVLAEDASGQELRFTARAVVDASGVLQRPRWLGDGGIPALGERECAEHIAYHVEALTPAALEGRRFAVIGAGYSAATMLEQFSRLQARTGCQVDWCVRAVDSAPLAPIENDPLPERDRLSRWMARLWRDGEPGIWLRKGVFVERLARDAAGVSLHTADATLGPYHRIYAMVGYAPDLSLSDELQFHACYATQGPMRLAAQLLAQSGTGDCLQIAASDAEALRNPEPGFYVIGAKSYGRNPDFLLQRLPEQIEAVLDMMARIRADQ